MNGQSPSCPNGCTISGTCSAILRQTIDCTAGGGIIGITSTKGGGLSVSGVRSSASLSQVHERVRGHRPHRIVKRTVSTDGGRGAFGPLANLTGRRDRNLKNSKLSLTDGGKCVIPTVLSKILTMSTIRGQNACSITPLDHTGCSGCNDDSVSITTPKDGICSACKAGCTCVDNASVTSPRMTNITSLLGSIRPSCSISRVRRLLGGRTGRQCGSLRTPTSNTRCHNTKLIGTCTTIARSRRRPAISTRCSASNNSD